MVISNNKMNFYDFLFLLSAVLGLTFYFVRRKYSYWERLNVPYIQPKFPLGNLKGLGGKVHLAQLFQNYYNELKGRGAFGGLYFFINPAVLATNLDFVKSVLIKDFNHFESRGMYYNEKDDPLSGDLFSIDGDKWRKLRSKLSPAFSSGKMKFMYPAITSVADEFKATINSSISDNNADLEMKDLLSRFTTDIIGTCAFGIECNSLKNANCDFRKYGRAIFEAPRNSMIKLLFLISFRETARKLKMKMIADDVSDFFMNTLKETIRYRETNNVQRNDFLNLMMQLLKNGKIDDEEYVNEVGSNKGLLTFEEIAAQCFVFFLAGFETSSTTLMFCLFELSVNPDIQTKARQEVIDVLNKYNGEFTYDAMMEMHYLDRCIQETLRKYPPIALLGRVCTKDYPVPNTQLSIAKGTVINIPVYGIHHDPEIYHKADIYDPERFTPEEVQKRHPLSFIPFGDGPRNCIGLRFGLMQTRVGLATMLKHFEFSPCSKSTNPLIINPKSLVLTPKDGLWLNVKKY